MRIYAKDNYNDFLKKNSARSVIPPREITEKVEEIIENVRKSGDKALFEYEKLYDGVELDNLSLGLDEARKIADNIPDELKITMARAAENIRRYHEGQKQQSRLFDTNEGIMGQRVIPLERVAVYVPGGTAAYPSSVLMNIIPAKIAGVEHISMFTPAKKEGINEAVLYAALLAGVDDIYTVGGAQAVAAAAFGTESIPKADKIVGPGNIYVATAKRLVYGIIDIDMIAGPSEIVVISDGAADPDFIAADLLSQAEHDIMASSIFITTSYKLAENVAKKVDERLKSLSRKTIAEKSIDENGAIFITDSIEDAIALSNRIAPEHLELMLDNPMEYLPLVKNAGSVFLGKYTPEPVGDYFGGPNHVLPTNGTARFASPLSVDSFIKKSSFICYDKKTFMKNAGDIIRFANAEGLTAHAAAVEARLKDE